MPPLVFLFRRDLRVADNHGLSACCEAAARAGAQVLPMFVADAAQADPRKNPYHSARAVAFMAEALEDLRAELPALRAVWSKARANKPGAGTLAALEAVVRECTVAAVYFNADWTPYARARDAAIREWCQARGIACVACETDASLVPPPAMAKPYQVFTPFLRRYMPGVQPRLARRPDARAFLEPSRRDGMTTSTTLSKLKERGSDKKDVVGGRRAALGILRRVLRGEFRDYDESRDDLADARGTTRLSPYVKFGCVSVREVFLAISRAYGREHGLAKQLMWRAFYEQLAYHFPRVLGGQLDPEGENASLRPRFDEAHDGRWSLDPGAHFSAWSSGRTGWPLVDAGMRQLAETGFMHNRLRMVVASFLVKQLGVDWRLGERFFARSLTDYDPASNSGGWQWSAGGGADPQLFSRRFNPARQAQKFDPRCEYVRRHVPELADVPDADVLAWTDGASKLWSERIGYPPPMRVLHSSRRNS